jgi:hypothetical protein
MMVEEAVGGGRRSESKQESTRGDQTGSIAQRGFHTLVSDYRIHKSETKWLRRRQFEIA